MSEEFQKAEAEEQKKITTLVNKVSSDAVYAMAVSMICFTTDAYEQETARVREVAAKLNDWADRMEKSRAEKH